ncbi:hypothetical protein J2Z42_002133 [Clostridium algifaecis]|uniref:Dipeptidylpeptidase IV N-terminal domain-containing protein n=1 Tax=Clostridium algifaecis TaxID=1472040 RepID=A0ABS4KTR9_9CLOT|nr:hypothetical protein [Clostridium algifaecis]MBP2033430.1 hypothetical protein [Clostridium algifaecis]
MKVLKKLIAWALIPIILELAGLFFIDKFYLGDESTFNIKKVDISSKKSHTKIKVKIPDDAKDVKISHNGNYVSYYENESIYVVDTDKNKKKEVDVADGAELSYYTWDTDSDVILMAEKISKNGSSYLEFEAYDAKRDSKTERKNDQNQVLEILLPNSNYEVENVAFSGASNVTYVVSESAGERSRIYRIDRMTRMNLAKFRATQLGNIAAINTEDGDQLIYEDRSSNRIRGKSAEPIATGENAMHYLLGADSNDYIYIGNGENDKINKIFVANLTKQRSSWKTYKLSGYTDKKNIYVLRDGRIYVNNPSQNTVTEVATGKSVQYEGKLAGVYNYGVISISGNKVLGSLFSN